jgi:TonB-linked SusC/RagA family outer membrane protein
MLLTFNCRSHGNSRAARSPEAGSHNKILRVMRITAFLIIVASLHVSASGNAQRISISGKNMGLEEVLDEVRKESGYEFIMTGDQLKQSRKITIQVKDVTVEEVLKLIFDQQPFGFEIAGKTIVIKYKVGAGDDTGIQKQTPPPVTVRGRITNEAGEPVQASVIVKGTQNGTTSNADGYYTLNNVDEKATLVVSSVSIESPVEVRVNSRVTVNIAVARKVKEGEEIVVAYNKISAKSNVGAVTVIKGEDIRTLPNRSFDKSLQGLVPGLLVTSGSGQPGSPPSNFLLRGIATGGHPINGETYRNPLIVIDGIPVTQEPPGLASLSGSTLTDRVMNPLAQLNPSDIETISVLKDAAAVALYGAKASNGVILVTTKKGKAGRTAFSFRHQTDISQPMEGKMKMLTQEEYLELLYETYKNSDPATWTYAAILADLKSKFPTMPDGSFFPQSDWTGAMFNNAAVTIVNEISASGGSDRSNFYINLEYSKQNGVAKNTGYDRKSFRFNYEHRAATWLKLGVNTAMSYNIQKYSPANSNNFLTTTAISPLNPIRDLNDNYIYDYPFGHGLAVPGLLIPNPVAQMELNISKSTAYRGLSQLTAEMKLLRNLSFNSSVGIDFMINEAKEKSHPLVSGSGGGSISEQLSRLVSIINTNLIQFNKEWNKTHSLNILAGHEAMMSVNKYVFVSKNDISANPGQDQLIGGNIIAGAHGNTSKQTQLSYFGQVNYGFRERYYLTGSVRSDGSSRFGKNNRYGTYWSIGGAWIVSAEPFMKKANSWLSNLKLRGSMGPSGNSAAIANQFRFDVLLLGNFLNNVVVYPGNGWAPGNPSIKWEETFNWNTGVEVGLFKNRISLVVDKYTRKTKNMIAYNINAALGTGFSSLTDNIGDVKNTGIEISVRGNIVQSKNFSWSISANWGRNRNILTKSFYPSTSVVGTNLVNRMGYEYNSFYMPRWAGVNPDNGRPMWIDSTGKPNENWSAAKPEIVGKSQPDGFGGIGNTFNYKGLSLAVRFFYQYGSSVYLNSNLQNDGNSGTDPYFNQSRNALDRWQKPGDIAANPRRLLNGIAITGLGTVVDAGTLTSTRYLYDGDFIRLANITLSYSIPKKLIERLHLSTVSVLLQGNNLATWTRYSGQDPENVGPSGFGSIIYPQARSYSIGLNVGF